MTLYKFRIIIVRLIVLVDVVAQVALESGQSFRLLDFMETCYAELLEDQYIGYRPYL